MPEKLSDLIENCGVTMTSCVTTRRSLSGRTFRVKLSSSDHVEDVSFYMGVGRKDYPSVALVLSSLLKDARMSQGSYEDFYSNCGGTREQYRACRYWFEKGLPALLGPELFESFMEAEDDL
jgi:hypothetical protein